MAKLRGNKPHLRPRSARGYELTYRNAAGYRDTQTIRANTKTEARRLADEFLTNVERSRLRLERAVELITHEDAFWRYAKVASAKRSWPQEFGRWKNHILGLEPKNPSDAGQDDVPEYARPQSYWRARSELAKKLLHESTSDDLEVLYAVKLKEGQKPRSIRQLKAHLGKFYRWAIQKAKLIRGENPGWMSELPCEILPTETKAMSEAQLEQLLTRGFDDFGTFFLLIFDAHTGLRRGELAGLTWDNVHEDDGFVWVCKSFDGPTKGKPAQVPIHPALLRYIRAAREHARSDYVFPGQDGKMRPRSWKAAEVFRTCLKRAGLIQGYVQVCGKRRGARTGTDNPKSKLKPLQVAEIRARAKRGESYGSIAKLFRVSPAAVRYHALSSEAPRAPGKCGYVSRLIPEAATGPCPTCGAPLLAQPVPLAFTLKHLRSSFGSYVVEQTGSLRAAQLFLRHAEENTTDKHYVKRRDSFLEAQMSRVTLISADKLPTAFGDYRLAETTSGDEQQQTLQQLPLVATNGGQ